MTAMTSTLPTHAHSTAWSAMGSSSPAFTAGRALLVLPAFNEEETLPNLFARLQVANVYPATGLVAFVVDDGSSDRTAEIARKGAEGLDIRLIQHERNQGLGQAFQTGLAAASRFCRAE
ncbi:MAG: glycosyltransferase family 2 protein [Chthoniobacteraceae bacterium]